MIASRSKLAEKVLTYFFLNPHSHPYVNELARQIEVDLGNLFRYLISLEKEGLLLSERRGKERFFYLNPDYPLLKETQKWVELKWGLPQKLANALKNLKGLKEAYIYGSYAKGTMTPESDIDLLLVGDHSALKAIELLNPLEKVYHRELSKVDMSPKEFLSRKKKRDPFITHIFQEKIIKII